MSPWSNLSACRRFSSRVAKSGGIEATIGGQDKAINDDAHCQSNRLVLKHVNRFIRHFDMSAQPQPFGFSASPYPVLAQNNAQTPLLCRSEPSLSINISSIELQKVLDSLMDQVNWLEVAIKVAKDRPPSVYCNAIEKIVLAHLYQLMKVESGCYDNGRSENNNELEGFHDINGMGESNGDGNYNQDKCRDKDMEDEISDEDDDNGMDER